MQPSFTAFCILLVGGFLTSLGYGILLPVMPEIVGSLHTAATQQTIALHTGFVTAIYAAAAFVAAPLWGRLSDRATGSKLIASALAISGVATILGIFAPSLNWLYFWRFAAGAGAGAVGPATQAWLSRWAKDDRSWTSKRVVWSAIAQNSGFLLGPFAGGLAASMGYDGNGGKVPLFATGGLLLLSAAIAITFVGRAPPNGGAGPIFPVTRLAYRIAPMLCGLLVTATAVGSFEVALTLKIGPSRMEPLEAGFLLAECTLFMSAAQVLLVIPRVRDLPARAMIPAALVALAAGLLGAAMWTSSGAHVVSTALFALGGGLLPPLLSREIASADGGASGSANGLQSAATQAGQMLGGILAGIVAAVLQTVWVFGIAAVPVIALAILNIWIGRTAKSRTEKQEGDANSLYRNSGKESF